jgi:hypothetical protein
VSYKICVQYNLYLLDFHLERSDNYFSGPTLPDPRRPYFALPNVLNGMFQLVERLFGIQVTKVDVNDESSDVQVWHPDVSFYHVHDVATGKHIASFYLDPYSRPAGTYFLV